MREKIQWLIKIKLCQYSPNTAQRHDNVPLEETSSNRIGFSSSYPIKTVILPAWLTGSNPASSARPLDSSAVSNLGLHLCGYLVRQSACLQSHLFGVQPSGLSQGDRVILSPLLVILKHLTALHFVFTNAVPLICAHVVITPFTSEWKEKAAGKRREKGVCYPSRVFCISAW